MSGTVLNILETGSLFFIKPWEKKVTLVKTTAAPMRPTITFQVKKKVITQDLNVYSSKINKYKCCIDIMFSTNDLTSCLYQMNRG